MNELKAIYMFMCCLLFTVCDFPDLLLFHAHHLLSSIPVYARASVCMSPEKVEWFCFVILLIALRNFASFTVTKKARMQCETSVNHNV